MLSEKPWNIEAMIRWLLGVFICLCLGTIIVTSFHYAGPVGLDHIGFYIMGSSSVLLLAMAVVVVTRRWNPENTLRRLLLVVLFLSAGLSFAAWAQNIAGRPPAATAGEQMVVAEAAVLIFLVGFIRGQHVSWSDAFGLGNQRGKAILSGLVLACIFLPVGEGLQWISAELMLRFRIEPHEQEAVQALRVTSTWWNRGVLAVLALVLAPVV